MRVSNTTTPVRGYGLMIYDNGDREVCGFLDGSPVLSPARIEHKGARRRLRFKEGSREVRSSGDIFCSDAVTADFVRLAVNEKIERDLDAANAFRIVDTHVSRRGKYLFLTVYVVGVNSDGSDSYHFVLEAPSYSVQQDGQREFGRFLDAVGLTSVDDSAQLHGLTATFEIRGGEPIYKRWDA